MLSDHFNQCSLISLGYRVSHYDQVKAMVEVADRRGFSKAKRWHRIETGAFQQQLPGG